MRKFTPYNKKTTSKLIWLFCTLDRIRTCGLLIRSQLLYPAELRGHYIAKISTFQQGKITLIHRFIPSSVRKFYHEYTNENQYLLHPYQTSDE